MRLTAIVVLIQLTASTAMAQSSSLLLSAGRSRSMSPAGASNGQMSDNRRVSGNGSMFATVDPKDETLPMTRAIERVSLYAIPAQVPRKFKVQDLITVIVRQQSKYEADAQAESKRKWNLMYKLSDWFSFNYDKPGNKIGEEQFLNGEPGVKFDVDNKNKMEGNSDRENKYSTRITAWVIDVKPNGNLVLEATLHEQHDEELASITLTGICRSSDVTPDNTVMSTQLADLQLVEKNHGSVRDATTRGWVPKILSYGGGPF